MIVKLLASLILAMAASCVNAATYVYTGNAYTNLIDYTAPCSAGPCANYSTSMRVTGSIRTALPLAPNLVNQDITALIASYTFSDGVNTIASSAANARIYYPFKVSTDASGQITAASVLLTIWESGTSPHTTSDRWSNIAVGSGSGGYNNLTCTTIGVSSAGAADSCTVGGALDGDVSASLAMTPGSWASPSAAPVPTLNQCGLGLVILGVTLGFGMFSCLQQTPVLGGRGKVR